MCKNDQRRFPGSEAKCILPLVTKVCLGSRYAINMRELKCLGGTNDFSDLSLRADQHNGFSCCSLRIGSGILIIRPHEIGILSYYDNVMANFSPSLNQIRISLELATNSVDCWET